MVRALALIVSVTSPAFFPRMKRPNFSPEKSFTKAVMMGGMSETSVLIDNKQKTNIMLMSIMGQKMKIDMNEEELKDMQSGGQGDLSGVEYKHSKDQVKEILGFKCHKVEVIIKDSNEMGMTFWVTDQLKTTAHVSNGIQTEMLEGFPMEYVISMAGQLKMTMTSTVFEKEYDDSIFNLDTTGYKEMTLKEFMDTMGSMGGGF
mgnify:CR=1 FL=1